MLVEMSLKDIGVSCQRRKRGNISLILWSNPSWADPDPLNDLFESRAWFGSDGYFDLGLTNGTIALLDTGIRSSHVVFSNPSNLFLQRDCVNGGNDCNTGVLSFR